MDPLQKFLTHTCRICARDDKAVYTDLTTSGQIRTIFEDLFPLIKIEGRTLPTVVCHLCIYIIFEYHKIWNDSYVIQQKLAFRFQELQNFTNAVEKSNSNIKDNKSVGCTYMEKTKSSAEEQPTTSNASHQDDSSSTKKTKSNTEEQPTTSKASHQHDSNSTKKTKSDIEERPTSSNASHQRDSNSTKKTKSDTEEQPTTSNASHQHDSNLTKKTKRSTEERPTSSIASHQHDSYSMKKIKSSVEQQSTTSITSHQQSKQMSASDSHPEKTHQILKHILVTNDSQNTSKNASIIIPEDTLLKSSKKRGRPATPKGHQTISQVLLKTYKGVVEKSNNASDKIPPAPKSFIPRKEIPKIKSTKNEDSKKYKCLLSRNVKNNQSVPAEENCNERKVPPLSIRRIPGSPNPGEQSTQCSPKKRKVRTTSSQEDTLNEWQNIRVPGKDSTLYLCRKCNTILLKESGKREHKCPFNFRESKSNEECQKTNKSKERRQSETYASNSSLNDDNKKQRIFVEQPANSETYASESSLNKNKEKKRIYLELFT